jgi:polyisoprenoid-binding protein YceI
VLAHSTNEEEQLSTIEQAPQTVPAGTWNADPVHSTVGFAIDYMAGTFQGTFSEVQSRIVDGELSGLARVSSIQVKDPNLEAHLQSPDFFDAERYPELSFRSREIRRDGDGLTISGELTMKGHTEPVELRGHVTEPIQDPFGNERFGLKLETTVDRTAFGISWNNPLPTGKPSLSNEVTIVADLQYVREA